MTDPRALAQLRHLYQNMVNGAVRDTASAKRIAENLLATAIEALERGTPPAVAGEPIGYLYCGGSYGDELADWEIVADQHQCDKLNEHHGSLGKEARLPLYVTPQPAQAQDGAVPLTYQQVIAAWNAQADEHNQWDALGEDEKIEWAVACAKAAPQAVVEPLTDEQIQEAILPINPHGMGYFLRIARAIERAHGIGIKGGLHGAE